MYVQHKIEICCLFKQVDRSRPMSGPPHLLLSCSPPSAEKKEIQAEKLTHSLSNWMAAPQIHNQQISLSLSCFESKFFC